MQSYVALSVIAGLVSGGAFLSILLGQFAQLPLLVAGLSLGVVPTLIAGGSGVVLVGLLAGGTAAFMYLLLELLPAAFVTRQALLSRSSERGVEWYPPGRILSAMAAFAAVLLTAVLLQFTDHQRGVVGSIEDALYRVLDALPALANEASLRQDVPQLARAMPGFLAASWVMMLAVNVLLAQALVRARGRNIRPSLHVAELELPSWTFYVLAAAVVVSVIAEGALGVIGQGVLLVFLVPYLFLGLVVVHALLGRLSSSRGLLAAFYIVAVLLLWPLALVVILGLVEQWAGVRRRFT